jgi:hypothetical protein
MDARGRLALQAIFLPTFFLISQTAPMPDA